MASSSNDGFVFAWDIRTPSKPIQSLSSYSVGISQVKYSATSAHNIACLNETALLVWDLRYPSKPTSTIKLQTKINRFDWSPVKNHICYASDSCVFIKDLDSNIESSFNAGFPVLKVSYTPFNAILVVPRKSSPIALYKLGDYTAPLQTFQEAHEIGYIGVDSLVTWSRDFTISVYPIENNVFLSLGFERELFPASNVLQSSPKPAFKRSKKSLAEILPPKLSSPGINIDILVFLNNLGRLA